MTKEYLQELPNQELLSLLIIEDHNIESCYRKKEEFKDNDSFMDLFTTFTQNYSLVWDEIMRRMYSLNNKDLTTYKLIMKYDLNVGDFIKDNPTWEEVLNDGSWWFRNCLPSENDYKYLKEVLFNEKEA